jgi:hypothetical protein
MRETRARFGLAAVVWWIAVAAPSAVSAFDPGEVYWAAGWCSTPPCGLQAAVAGDHLGESPIGSIDRAPGQIAWAAGNGTAYVTEFDTGSIVAVTSAGAVSTFATNIVSPTGLLRTQSGDLLAVSWTYDAVYVATPGGDLTSAAVFADGFGGPRNLIQLSSGAILIADQVRHVVYDISAGGNFSTAVAFAHGLPGGPYDLAEGAGGKIFASTDGGVFEISAGGDFSTATAHAYGIDFGGLAIDSQGRILASRFANGDVFDITTSGDYSLATPFATNFPGLGDTALDTVPGAGGTPPAPQLVPALATTGRIVLAVLILSSGVLRFKAVRRP